MSVTAGPAPLARGTPPYRRATLAMVLAGFSTFSLLYCVQPLLPEFSRVFGVAPATSALSLSLTTAALALAIAVAGALPRGAAHRLMAGSMLLGALLNLAAAAAPSWPALLAARLLEGLALGGVPAVAMAYLADEMEPRDLGRVMGLYVAGTAFGGMMGRVTAGVLADLWSWRVAMGVWGGLSMASAVAFARLLPPPRRTTASPGAGLRHHLAIWAGLVRRAEPRRLLLTAFLLMSVFVSLFNYVGYRLADPPYALGETALGLVALTYVFGMAGSAAAGWLIDRLGRRGALLAGLAAMQGGVAVSLLAPLPAILAGIGLATAGFFAAHSVASGAVGRAGGPDRGQAAALYLLFYYAGSSLTGSAAGWVWGQGGWPAIAALTSALTLLAAGLAAGMRDGPPRG